jgi:hypothetical protein
MKPRTEMPRLFGCPPILWFDDPEKLHHYLGKSVSTLHRMEKERGLRIHATSQGKYVKLDEYLACLEADERRTAVARLGMPARIGPKRVPATR